MSNSRSESDILVLDAQTQKDLDIFESEGDGKSLFEFCNLARSKGGAKALRRRMENPWSDGDRIKATQKSLSFITEQRAAFTKMPSAYAAGRVEHYKHDALPMVTQLNALGFGLNAFSLWATHDRHYYSIVHGVKITCGLIQSLRHFVAQAELSTPGGETGEIGPIIEEMRTLLSRQNMSRVPEDATLGWTWKILRLDQLFRLLESAAIDRLLQLTYELDALIAMADVTAKHDFVMPDIDQGPLRVHAEALVHPFVKQAVANPVELDQDRRVLFLTGPNMAGKTTYLRAFATALYLAHLGMGVPAASFRFVPAERIFSSISISDNLRAGVSYFRAEALRVKAIAAAVADGYRVVALLDEPFKGTNVKDAFDASLAILERFATRADCLFLFSSHLIEISEHFSDIQQIDCRYFQADEGEGRLRFDYLLRDGISSQRLGMRVLREEGVFELLDLPPTEK